MTDEYFKEDEPTGFIITPLKDLQEYKYWF